MRIQGLFCYPMQISIRYTHLENGTSSWCRLLLRCEKSKSRSLYFEDWEKVVMEDWKRCNFWCITSVLLYLFNINRAIPISFIFTFRGRPTLLKGMVTKRLPYYDDNGLTLPKFLSSVRRSPVSCTWALKNGNASNSKRSKGL